MSYESESPFRILLGFFWVTYTVIRLYFQSKVKESAVAITAHEQQSHLYFRLFALAFLLILFYILTPWLDWASLYLPPTVRWVVGTTILIGYIALFAWTHAALGKNWSGFLELYTEHSLVVTGPYRFIRHPMYAAFILSGIGFFVLSANWFVGGLYLVIAILMYLDRVGPEEQMMIDRFGDEYRRYMEKTGRLVPSVRK